MGLDAKDTLNTEEYGFIELKRIYEHNLPCKILCYDPSVTQVNFFPLINIELEARKSYYIIHTLKQNRIVITPDILIFSNNEWVLPEKLTSGLEIWTNHAKTIVTDVIIDIQYYIKPIKAYSPKITNDLPFFANKILLKNQI
jgi:hypothetical protein